jgi:hypothetical protein
VVAEQDLAGIDDLAEMLERRGGEDLQMLRREVLEAKPLLLGRSGVLDLNTDPAGYTVAATQDGTGSASRTPG